MKIYFIRQQDAMDCGPSCLAMIAGHYGLHPDVEALRKACALGMDGVSLLGISKAAEEIGFHTIGGRLTLDSLITEAKLPCILHWKQNHFVVENTNTYTISVLSSGRCSVCEMLYDNSTFCVGDLRVQTLESAWNSTKALNLYQRKKSFRTE